MTMTHASPRNERDCPGCGLPREDWPDNDPGGFTRDGAVYCCRGCAAGTGCTCRRDAIDSGRREPAHPADHAMTEEEIRRDPASSAFVHSLQRETKAIRPEHYGTPITRTPPGPDAAHD